MIKLKNVRNCEARLPGSHNPCDTMSRKTRTADAELEKLQLASFNYFLHETNPLNGLVIDKTEADWPDEVLGAIELSRATLRKMYQNLSWAVGYNVIVWDDPEGDSFGRSSMVV